MSPSPEGCIPSWAGCGSDWHLGAGTPSCWVQGEAGQGLPLCCQFFPTGGRLWLSAPIFGYFWKRVFKLFIKFHLAEKVKWRCSTKATWLDDESSSFWRAVLPPPSFSHLRSPTVEPSWDQPSSSGATECSCSNSPTIAIAAAIHSN